MLWAPSVDANASVENRLKKLIDYASRPLPDFIKFQAVTVWWMREQITHMILNMKKNYYRLAYKTLRGNSSTN